MPQIDVCLSPKLIQEYGIKGKIVVVVDILRATSCMVTALANGAQSIIPVATVEECSAYKGDEKCLKAAERDGKKVEGFELGNSPYSYLDPYIDGSSIVITTTNGTLAIQLSTEADEILIGAFLNISALAQYLLTQEKDVLIVCAGWKNKMNLEDTIFAGALVQLIESKFSSTNDSTVAARVLHEIAKIDLFKFITGHSSHYKRLQSLHLDKDIKYCLQFDIYSIIPKMYGHQMLIMGSDKVTVS
ncbi:MAG: 2-phosphosulfolactate phosphatase [Cytophagales bacterium]|nr:MAG: 2-phosphosulfolactate phosphatase [Cytophagales bacterium]